MNINFANSCYDIAALSTCILENKEWESYAIREIPITKHLGAIAAYRYIDGDIRSLVDYETHHFSLEFMRNGIPLDEYTYDKVIRPDKYGSLADPDIDVDTKLDVLGSLRPGAKDAVKAFFTRTNLTPEEQLAVMAKRDEIVRAILGMAENRGL